MKKLLLALPLLLPGCQTFGSADAALALLTATEAYQMAEAYGDCLEEIDSADPDLMVMAQDLLLYMTIMQDGDLTVAQAARELAGHLAAAHDACVSVQPTLTESERSERLTRSARFLQHLDMLVARSERAD